VARVRPVGFEWDTSSRYRVWGEFYSVFAG